MAVGAGETFLGLDIGTSSIKALLIDAEQRTVADASVAAVAVAAAAAVERAERRRLGRGGRRRGGGVCARARPTPSRGLPASASPARCTARRSSTPPASRSGRRSCGTTAAPSPNASSSNAACPICAAAPATSPCPASPRRRRCGSRPRAGGFRRDQAHPAAEGLCAAAADRRSGLGHVGRFRHAVARRRQTALGRRAARRHRPQSLAHMPSLVEGSEVSAYLSPEIAAAWGLAGRRIPVAGGAGDNAAAAVGVGAIAPGAGFVSVGTSGVVFSVTDRFVCLPERTLHAFCHALPERWHGMAVMLSAAAALTWIAERARARRRRRRLRRRRRGVRQIGQGGRGRAGVPALSQRRAHAAQRRRRRPACSPD